MKTEFDTIQWRPYQNECISNIYTEFKKGIKTQLIKSATGCHAGGTKILMYDGTIKEVQQIIVGDLLMGDDSTPRKVLERYSGMEPMARIIPIKGESFIVNMSHILSLKKTTTRDKYKNMEDIVNISVLDYINMNKHFKHLYKLYRTGVEFERTFYQDFNDIISPYFLGLWLGDGCSRTAEIVSADIEIQEYLENLPSFITKYHKGNGLYLFRFRGGIDNSPVKDCLKKFMTFDHSKIITEKHLAYSYKDRLEILAGLIDSDGSLSCNGYDFINKNKTIADAVVYLSRSLGLAAYISKCKKKCFNNGVIGDYYRVSISGETSIIPCKVKRKIATKRKQKKNPLVTGFKIGLLNIDNYYGFELDGNNLYCMGDFTVTHNTGKRLLAVFIASKFKRPLFIAHREELIDQAFADFEKYSPFETGILKGKRDERDKRILICSIQTLTNRYEQFDPEEFDCILVDEVHHYMAPTYIKPLEYFKPKLLTGWTATPKRFDGLTLGNLFDKMTFDYSIERGVREGYLAKIDAYRIQTEVDLTGVKRVAGDFNQKELSVVVNTRHRNALIAQKLHKYWKGEPVMAFCVDIQHAYDLRDILREHGFSAETIVSDEVRCPNRKELIKQFKAGEFNVLTNVNILTEGFDFPDAGIGIMARPTQSETLYIQMIGRLTRPKSNEYIEKTGHNKAIVLDFADLTRNHSLVNCYELEKNKPVKDRIFLNDADKDSIMRMQQQRTMKLVTFYGTDQPVDLLLLPDIFISNSPKMKEEATEKQIDFMKSLGVWQEGIEYTKRDASELIGSKKVNYPKLKELADLGYDVTNGATINQYQQVVKQNIIKEDRQTKFVLKDVNYEEIFNRK